MSKSRLEKFLYALYSLDSSDLPTPLSRIEELYKCWVTGEETPTFEPLSRVEKYLMTILGAYDLDELPNPISRVEVFLYKLAIGDDNLDDIKSFLSEHEELLAEIIRNGGVGGNIEYVLYTLSTEFNMLYNTEEKPVKSAILKGQTLVNLWDNIGQHSIAPGAFVRQVGDCFKKSAKYLLKYNVLQTNTNNIMIVQYYQNDSWVGNEPSYVKLNEDYYILTAPSADFNKIHIFYSNDFGTETVILENIMLLEYQDGMENWDIPYFEGMKSVQMPVLTTTGNNLWYGDKDVFSNGCTTLNMSFKKGTYYFTGDVDTVYPDGPTTMVFSNTFTGYGVGVYINIPSSSATLKEDCNQVKIYTNGWSFANSNNKPQTIKNLMLSSTYPISYEPHKSNILTVNEPVELRGIGEVKDELNLITGELTQRVGEIVFDGSENWLGSAVDSAGTFMRFHTIVQDAYLNEQGNDILCDRFTSMSHGNWDKAIEGIYSKQTTIHINIPTSKLESNDASGFKKWLSSNPVTVCYRLATESIKTVDLSTVNQDGNNTKLKTFDDITYITLSSEGLIPEAEMEVSTKNEEVLDTMSLRMDDISAAQTTIEETSDAQSENVDATMFATTEIYEELL